MNGEFGGFYRGKRVLVTGHTGFKGAWLSLWLRHIGADVWGLSLAPTTRPNLHEVLAPGTFTLETECDVADLEGMRGAVEAAAPDIVFHLAAQAFVRRSYADPLTTFRTNVFGSLHVLAALRSAGAQATVVMVTSDKCYENVGGREPFREDDRLGGNDPYSASKAATEVAVRAWRDSFCGDSSAIRIATARAGNVVGGGDYGEDRILPDCIRALAVGAPIRVRHPEATRPWQHVLECTSGYLQLGAMLATASAPERLAGAFNFGPDPSCSWTVRRVVEEVLRNWPGTWEHATEPAGPLEAAHLALSIDKARALLGWRPAWNPSEAIRRAVEWYRRRHVERTADLRALALQQIEGYADDARAAGNTWASRVDVGEDCALECRSCAAREARVVLDLGLQPLVNDFRRADELDEPEPRFPLRLAVCTSCWLLQITDVVPPDRLYSDYRYFSSYSDDMVEHARAAAHRYVEESRLDERAFVVEIGSNDGYLLQHFVRLGIPCVGIEPAANVARAAREKGVESLVAFFTADRANELARSNRRADLVLANNVFAHAPSPHDFVAGLACLLKPNGQAILEFPYAVDLVERSEFDTVYHEHVFVFALLPLVPILARHGLEAFHVERLPIHGGSLRLFAGHAGARIPSPAVAALLEEERSKGVDKLAYYGALSRGAIHVKQRLTALLAGLKARGHTIAAYGASAKGSTLLNFLGIGPHTVDFIADRSPHKHGRYSPGTRIPVVPAEELVRRMPHYALLLAWNLEDEIRRQQAEYERRGGRFIVPFV